MNSAAKVRPVTRSARRAPLRERHADRAFSLIEVLVATAILAVILGIIFSITQVISQTWKSSSAKIEAFQAGRGAFEAMSHQISQATLNTYYDYFDSSGRTRASFGTNTAGFEPDHYGRYSDLHFLSGKSLVTNQVGHSLFFQAPIGYTDGGAIAGSTNTSAGMDTLLNACGYFVVYDKDNSRPLFLDDGTVPNQPGDRYRFRLMQFLQPDQSLKVYDPAASGKKDWFTEPLGSSAPPVRILAENVVAVVILPKLSDVEDSTAESLAPDFEYDTRPATISPVQGVTDYQLPPVVDLVMVAIDEPSAQRICLPGGMPDFGVTGGLNSLFQKVDLLETDLKKLTDALIGKQIAYRIFRTQVALRGAKWSSEKTP